MGFEISHISKNDNVVLFLLVANIIIVVDMLRVSFRLKFSKK
jgi:hypothetical protein